MCDAVSVCHTTQEVADAKRARDEAETKLLMAQKIREKDDDARARARVKELLEADKAARAAQRAGTAHVPPPVAPPATTAPTPSTATPAQCRLQIRQPTGTPIIGSFASSAPLADVVRVLIATGDGNACSSRLCGRRAGWRRSVWC